MMRSFVTQRPADIPFLILGASFLGLAVAEYFLPGGLGEDRPEVKVLCGMQGGFALAGGLLGTRSARVLTPLHISLLLLCIWLCSNTVIQARDATTALHGCAMFVFWYSMFLFCYVRIQADAGRSRLFLITLIGSLPIWLAALRNSMALDMELAGRREGFEMQNYLSYYMVAMFPYALLLRHRALKVIAMLVISFGAMYSLKRGAVLALVLMGLGASVVYVAVLCNGARRTRAGVGLLVLWGVGVAMAVLYWRANPVAVDRRLASGVADRSNIYAATAEQLSKATPFEAIAGQGCLASVVAIGHEPHNDWLFLQYDFGIVGVLLMLNVYFFLFVLLWRLCRLRSPLALSLISSIVLLACVQMYSTGLYVKTLGFITGSIGLVAGCFQAGSVYPDDSGTARPFRPSVG